MTSGALSLHAGPPFTVKSRHESKYHWYVQHVVRLLSMA